LSESDSEKLKSALHALAERLLPQPKTEKISSVFGAEERATPEEGRESDSLAGHGRNGADAYRGTEKVENVARRRATFSNLATCVTSELHVLSVGDGSGFSAETRSLAGAAFQSFRR
jgi:hypothetical protein